MTHFYNSSLIAALKRSLSVDHAKNNSRCIFECISPFFMKENYQSDILSYYLQEPFVKQKMFEWLNNERLESDKLLFSEYEHGKVLREPERIDILILSNDGKKAVILESKSNNACDQPRQLARYVNSLKKTSIDCQAIIYLTKSKVAMPSTEGWSKEEIAEITPLIRSVNLFDLTESLINPVLHSSNDIRLCGLSAELEVFFKNQFYDGINMIQMEDFSKVLSINNNYAELQEIIKAYEGLPKFWCKEYKRKIEQILTKNQHNPERYIIDTYFTVTEKYVFIEIKNLLGKYVAIDIKFTNKNVEFSIVPRKQKGSNQEDIDLIRNHYANSWPFSDKRKDNGNYMYTIDNPLNEQAILDYINKVIFVFDLKSPSC